MMKEHGVAIVALVFCIGLVVWGLIVQVLAIKRRKDGGINGNGSD